MLRHLYLVLLNKIISVYLWGPVITNFPKGLNLTPIWAVMGVECWSLKLQSPSHPPAAASVKWRRYVTTSSWEATVKERGDVGEARSQERQAGTEFSLWSKRRTLAQGQAGRQAGPTLFSWMLLCNSHPRMGAPPTLSIWEILLLVTEPPRALPVH